MNRLYTMSAAGIVNKVRALINDDHATAGYRTSDAELLGWINDALNVLLNIRPGLFSITQAYACVAGYRQEITNTRAVQLAEVVGLPTCDRATLTQFLPGWTNATPGIPLHWMQEPADPLRFDVYPPALANTPLTVRIVQAPTPVSALTSVIEISENYEAMLVEYVAGRAQIRDDEYVNSNRASLLMDRFVAQAKGI